MGSGHYRDPYLDRAWFDEHDAGAIAAILVDEARNGVGGVRPGRRISTAEERSFRAAARAHLETGLTISTHAAW